MAQRPVFLPTFLYPTSPDNLVRAVSVSFDWHAGIRALDKQRNVQSLHEGALMQSACSEPLLEVSTKSLIPLGRDLSAFNLHIMTPSGLLPVEAVYQSAKVFAYGLQYNDLMFKSGYAAKTDPRIRAAGDVIGFRYGDTFWPGRSGTGFYDWLYLTALAPHQMYLRGELMQYGGFTDIAFNPVHGMACQARTCAMAVSLIRANALDDVLANPGWFLQGNYRR